MFQPDYSQLPEVGPDGQAADAKEKVNPEDKSVNQIVDVSLQSGPEIQEQMQSNQAPSANAEIAGVWDIHPPVHLEHYTTIGSEAAGGMILCEHDWMKLVGV